MRTRKQKTSVRKYSFVNIGSYNSGISYLQMLYGHSPVNKAILGKGLGKWIHQVK
jgi:hypothetical protein